MLSRSLDFVTIKRDVKLFEDPAFVHPLHVTLHCQTLDESALSAQLGRGDEQPSPKPAGENKLASQDTSSVQQSQYENGGESLNNVV